MDKKVCNVYHPEIDEMGMAKTGWGNKYSYDGLQDICGKVNGTKLPRKMKKAKSRMRMYWAVYSLAKGIYETKFLWVRAYGRNTKWRNKVVAKTLNEFYKARKAWREHKPDPKTGFMNTVWFAGRIEYLDLCSLSEPMKVVWSVLDKRDLKDER